MYLNISEAIFHIKKRSNIRKNVYNIIISAIYHTIKAEKQPQGLLYWRWLCAPHPFYMESCIPIAKHCLIIQNIENLGIIDEKRLFSKFSINIETWIFIHWLLPYCRWVCAHNTSIWKVGKHFTSTSQSEFLQRTAAMCTRLIKITYQPSYFKYSFKFLYFEIL